MESAGQLIRKLRLKEGYPLKKVAAFLGIDQAILSKMERGQRKLSKEQVIKLAEFFKYDEKELLLAFLSDKIGYEIKNEALGKEALKIAEAKVEYLTQKNTDRNEVIKNIKKYLGTNEKVMRAWIFGSFARGEYDNDSDIDLMIEVDPSKKFSLFEIAEIKFRLEKLLSIGVDVIMKNAPEPHVMERIKRDMILIHEK